MIDTIINDLNHVIHAANRELDTLQALDDKDAANELLGALCRVCKLMRLIDDVLSEFTLTQRLGASVKDIIITDNNEELKQ